MHRLVISVSLPVGALMLTYFFSTEDLYPIDTLVHVLDIEMLHIPITTRQGDGQAVCLVRAIKRFAQVGQEGHIVVKITLTDSTDQEGISYQPRSRSLDVDGANSESASPEQSTSEYLTPSSPITSGSRVTTRVTTRAAASCAPLSGPHHHESSSDSEADPTASAGRKRGFSQVTSSPPTQRSAPQADRQGKQSGQSHSHVAPYCTQKCLLGLQQGSTLDPECPNTELHMLGGRVDRHPIGAADLVKRLKMQLDQDLDHNCTPIGPCGSSGAPFKITCAIFGYTVVGKGTTSKLWGEVSREAEV
ncbi:hypothetical protein N7497_006170 [Penicillium chrysogenum]|nr:hypothetical protein N7497_006170 [Penicillium chrysogenum]